MTHPYLSEPARAAAFAYLTAHPHGSVRRWAQALGWTPSKFQRFIATLIREQLAEIGNTAFGSTFKPRIATDTLPTQSRNTSDTGHLEALGTRSLVPRCDTPNGNAEAWMCIAIANEELGAKFKHQYKPIQPDNYGSHRAVQEWLSAGMSLADMSRLLREKAAAFSLTNSGGAFPKSLAYFTRWMLHTWAIERRQIPLPLLTKTVRRPTMKKPMHLGEILKQSKEEA